MSIGAVGNAIFVNQQTASAASVQGNQNNRFDMQNVMAQAMANEKDEKVLEVRPAEENQEVDPDKEHQKQDADEENKRNEKESKDTTNNEYEEDFTIHKLDIKV